MARAVQTLPTSDFRGGINYNADAFQLAGNEVADAMNVDFDPAGGIARRRSVRIINTTQTASTPKNLWTYFSADGSTTKQLIAQVGQTIATSTGGNFTSYGTGVPFDVSVAGTMRAATAGNRCYIQKDNQRPAVRWDGTTATALTDPAVAPSYNDNLAAPAGGKMPKAKYICVHRNYLFHANLQENVTFRYSRIRFSFPSPDAAVTLGWEDYRTNDYIDVNPGDGDQITGIVSWNGRLVIFKNNSMYQMSGYGPDSFQIDNISKTVGAIGQEAICVGDEGIYFFSWPNGLQLFDGKSIHDLWYPMFPVSNGAGTRLSAQVIDPTYLSNLTLGYVNQRVWVNATTLGEVAVTTNNMTLVYDPRLGKDGGWTRYDTQVGPIVTWHPPGQDQLYYGVRATSSGAGYVLQLSVSDGADAYSASGGVRNENPVDSCVWTKFYDLGNPAVVKRWKHPIFVCDAANTMSLRCEVFTDYNFYSATGNFDVNITAPDPGMLWGIGTWDVDSWGGGVAGPQAIDKGASIGRGTSVALRICGPVSGDLPWAVNSVTFKYLPRRVRS